MSSLTIFVIGTAISALCLVGLILSVLEMKRLGHGGGPRQLSMKIQGPSGPPASNRTA